MPNLSTIGRNAHGFGFVEALGSFINNMKFKQGFNESQVGKDTKDAYIWKALSCMGEEYGEIIYENVLNYLDNASNVDLCKVKALQSLMQVVGIKYDVLNTFSSIPVELANLIDILSINRKYLLDSKTFKDAFIQWLKDEGVIQQAVPDEDTLSVEFQLSALSSISDNSLYLDEDQYEKFLYSVYNNVITSFVYMKYADAENGLDALHNYIYEYIQSDILAGQSTIDSAEYTAYQAKMAQLKIKCNIDKSFDQEAIVDSIENGYDSISNYSIFEQEVLKSEVERRQATYAYAKTYLSTYTDEGFNLTRYSYYREKKVKEYFKFIEDSYNNLIIEQGIKNTIESDVPVTIQQYEHDVDYFDIDQAEQKSLLSYDDAIGDIAIQESYIQAIVQLLVQQTLAIADIRDQVKLQIRKSYMRGTFLLISYVINEFLKYNISEHYGRSFSTEDGVDLSTILNQSITEGGNVELIEYYDPTEYFNITRDVDVKAKNGDTVNEKFWDNTYNKIGVNTKDLPLEEIEQFYKKQLKLEKKSVNDLVNFLSIIYEYGANNSYVSKKTDEFNTLIPGKDVGDDSYYIGDPYNEISSREDHILSVQQIHNGVDTYIENGYAQDVGTFEDQLKDLSIWVSSDYFWNEISTANEDLKEQVVEQICSDLDQAQQISQTFNEISSSYEELKSNPKYSFYLKNNIKRHYAELPVKSDDLKPYFIEKLHNFKTSVENNIDGILWQYSALYTSVDTMIDFYYGLSGDLYSKLFALSVWPNSPTMYWPYYAPAYENELTNVTLDLRNYLTSQAQVQNDEAIQHLQNHYDALLGFKEEINHVLQKCNEADAKLNAFATGIQTRIGVPNSQELDQYSNILVWSEQVDKMKAVKYSEKDDDGLTHVWYEAEIEVEDAFWLAEQRSYVAPALDTSDGIEDQIDTLIERSNYPRFTTKYLKTNKLIAAYYLDDYGWCTDTNIVQPYEEVADDWDDNGKVTKKHKEYDTISIPARYATTSAEAYLPDSAIYPYSSDNDESVKEDILNAYNNAVAELTSTVKLINDELTCLGYADINYGSSVNIDNVRTKTQTVYSQLIDRIHNLKEKIQAGQEPSGWQSLTASDANLAPYKKRLNRISAINISSATKYNIRYIETEFSKLQLSVQDLLANDSEYFEDYVNNEADRLDKQLSAIKAYSIDHDAKASAEVISAITDISSNYLDALHDFEIYSIVVNRKVVDSINNDYSYNLKTITYLDEIYNNVKSDSVRPYYRESDTSWPLRYRDCLDYLLSGDYVTSSYIGGWEQKLSGILFWLPNSQDEFEKSIVQKINEKIPELPAYIEITSLLDLANTKYSERVKDEDLLLTEKLDQIIDDFRDEINYISSQIPFYDTSHEIYLKYNGTDVGYDPFYNYKNLAYSSYQIHPYLYNFVEKSNIIYPLANNFFISFTDEYEKEMYEKGIDNILGQYGNVKETWKSGLFDWTSYQSKYERQANVKNFTAGATNPNVGFTGLFYPPAVKAFLDDRDTFLQNVQDDSQDSFYHHLNLTQNDCMRIYEQLLAYEPMIRDVATAQSTQRLSGEYDIYKFAEDCMGNSIFLLKSYRHLYEQHKDDPSYAPSYHEKRNTLGELWMRVKDHPLAFPAIDLRKGYEDLSQYSIKKTYNSKAEDINGYVLSINNYFKSHENSSTTTILQTAELTRDTIGRYEIGSIGDLDKIDQSEERDAQHLRCFFDFETDPLNQSLLLVVPYKTGNKNALVYTDDAGNFKSGCKLEMPNIRYADSSIVIAYLGDKVLFNSTSDQTHVYVFKTDVYKENNANIDNIANKQMLINGSIQYDGDKHNTKYFKEFVGFAKYKTYIYALFINKYFTQNNNSQFTLVYEDQKNKYKPQLEVEYVGYKCHLNPVSHVVASDNILYDIYDQYQDNDRIKDANGNMLDYSNASNVALADANGTLTLGFLTSRRQTYRDDYGNNSNIVNFAEYTSQVESYNSISTAGSNVEYPRSTALIQTNDSQHINIYNSFDSFTQYLVNVNFKFVGTTLKHQSTKYFNLNSDLGYLPQYVDVQGTSHYNKNTALCNATALNIELLGPEKSDIAFTPVIRMTEDEKYGRVVEEYKDVNRISVFNDEAITIPKNLRVATHTFILSSIYINDLTSNGMTPARALQNWNDLIETPELLRYKYIIYNTNYMSRPILKGNLSDVFPNGYYYQGSELYDLLSGEEIVGPNQTTYQNINMTNHIDNISAITANVDFDLEDTHLPSSLTLCCIARVADTETVISKNTFFMLIYAKNSIKSYEYYHLFENANANISQKLTQDQTWSIDLANTSADLSNLVIDGTSIYPFNSINPGAKYDKLSAQLEFKYSEEDPINREFPNIDPVDIEDEITIIENDSQSIYYFSLDDYRSISVDVFCMKTYEPDWIDGIAGTAHSYSRKINPLLPKYRDFYDKALIIEATYNMEKKLDDSNEYEIVQYFNYKNFTNPQYVKISWPADTTQPPSANIVDSTDESIEHTYLVLRPGQSGRLDIRVDFIDYQKLTMNAINQSIVGAYSQYLKTYYIMNVSDEKPKFIISRKPFSVDEGIEETDNYELEDQYYAGMAFQYIMMVISQTRSSDDTTSKLYNYVAMSQIAFKLDNGEKFEFPSNADVEIDDGAGASIVYPNIPKNLLNEDEDKEFFASNLSLSYGNQLSITIDLKSPAIDITQYSNWSWYNSHCSNSHVGYMPKSFMLAFSNDKRRWYKADEFSDIKNSLPTINYAEAYKGRLEIDE